MSGPKKLDYYRWLHRDHLDQWNGYGADEHDWESYVDAPTFIIKRSLWQRIINFWKRVFGK